MLQLANYWKYSLPSGHTGVYHHEAAGSGPKHTIYAFFKWYYWNSNEKRTKINKKRPRLAHKKAYKFIYLSVSYGSFTQSVLCGIIHHRLGHLKNKNIFFCKQMTILRGVICPSVNATWTQLAIAQSLFHCLFTETV